VPQRGIRVRPRNAPSMPPQCPAWGIYEVPRMGYGVHGVWGEGVNGLEIHRNIPVQVEGCSLAIVSHTLEGRTLTVTVSAPAAGRLTVSGRGLSTASKSAGGQGNVTFTVHVKKRGRFKTRLSVMFRPSHGAKQAKAVSLHV